MEDGDIYACMSGFIVSFLRIVGVVRCGVFMIFYANRAPFFICKDFGIIFNTYGQPSLSV